MNQPAPASAEHVEAGPADDKIETRELVQAAKRRIMEQRGLDEPDAFDFIQQTAMKSRRRMRDVAHDILQGVPFD